METVTFNTGSPQWYICANKIFTSVSLGSFCFRLMQSHLYKWLLNSNMKREEITIELYADNTVDIIDAPLFVVQSNSCFYVWFRVCKELIKRSKEQSWCHVLPVIITSCHTSRIWDINLSDKQICPKSTSFPPRNSSTYVIL